MFNTSKPFIRHCTIQDVDELAVTIRKEDVEEISLASGRTPLDTLMAGFRDSRSLQTIEWKGKVVAIFGVVGDPGEAGSPWMLGTDDLRRCWSVLRECQELVEEYTETYQYLVNSVWSKNLAHIRWLKWLGFQFNGSILKNGETFLYFHRRANV